MLADNGIGAKVFIELTEKDINSADLGLSYGGKKVIRKVLKIKVSGS